MVYHLVYSCPLLRSKRRTPSCAYKFVTNAYEISDVIIPSALASRTHENICDLQYISPWVSIAPRISVLITLWWRTLSMLFHGKFLMDFFYWLQIWLIMITGWKIWKRYLLYFWGVILLIFCAAWAWSAWKPQVFYLYICLIISVMIIFLKIGAIFLFVSFSIIFLFQIYSPLFLVTDKFYHFTHLAFSRAYCFRTFFWILL